MRPVPNFCLAVDTDWQVAGVRQTSYGPALVSTDPTPLPLRSHAGRIRDDAGDVRCRPARPSATACKVLWSVKRRGRRHGDLEYFQMRLEDVEARMIPRVGDSMRLESSQLALPPGRSTSATSQVPARSERQVGKITSKKLTVISSFGVTAAYTA